LVFGSFIGISPGLKMLRQMIEVVLFDRSQVKDGEEAVFVDSVLRSSIKANPLKSGTKSDGSHGSERFVGGEMNESLETLEKSEERTEDVWEPREHS
jgi:hypothetical protein